jgi:hypothetical protein
MANQPQRLLLTRMGLALSAVILASGVAAADEAPKMRADTAATKGPATDGPSTFDFMVFASMADSPHLVAMAGYRPVLRPCAAHPAGTAAGPAAGSKLPQCRL